MEGELLLCPGLRQQPRLTLVLITGPRGDSHVLRAPEWSGLIGWCRGYQVDDALVRMTVGGYQEWKLASLTWGCSAVLLCSFLQNVRLAVQTTANFNTIKVR